MANARRGFLRRAAGLDAPSAAVAGVVVRALPRHFAEVSAAISAMPNVEIPWQSADAGKIAVVLEADGDEAVLRQIESISALRGVVTADLSYAGNGDFL